MIYVTETLLYVCFCIITGGQILSLVPEDKRPTIEIPNLLIILCAGGIALLSFAPVFKIIDFLAKDFGESYWVIGKGVLLDFKMGHAWLYTLFFSFALIFIRVLRGSKKDPFVDILGLIFTLGLIGAFGWASHCASNFAIKGFMTHSTHFFAVSVWIGILLIAAWFSKDQQHWQAFFKWFSPVALVCVSVTVIAGLILMKFIVPEYLNSWMITYGQTLLIKHVLIIPLFVIAFMNGFLTKRKFLTHPNYDPKPWLRAESIMAILVLSATSVMGQQNPPHELSIENTIKLTQPSTLFTLFNQLPADFIVRIGVNLWSFVLLLLAALLIFTMLFIFVKRQKASLLVISMSLILAVVTYVTIMVSVVI
ncbi:copper resistance protein CopD [Paenibacillus sp. LMG 31460]|uniref:Copper resistance protein CopD n=1 Tax=Paenibacillus germinis TaxID=2654979 RepID=A0ABX1Z8R2_9BACL|nr:CopD family protein [Paenibacillus germinis]NOU88656.1 copper resistance protein CopD [Paenibacillus germinis]